MGKIEGDSLANNGSIVLGTAMTGDADYWSTETMQAELRKQLEAANDAHEAQERVSRKCRAVRVRSITNSASVFKLK